ncbi:MAG: acyltransferase family protein [Vicinamibacterales bacterium]
MGIVRLLFALLVVGSHVGGLGDTAAGGAGIGGFFVLSGFLMARAIGEHYRGLGVLRFYVNRIVRLAPPLVAVCLLTVLVLWLRDGIGFQLSPGSTGRYLPVEYPPSATHWFNLNLQPYPNYMTPHFYTVPQAWSLVVESAFYLVAPLFVWLVSRRLGVALVAAAAASFYIATETSFTTSGDWMRSPVAAFWIFGLGMLVFTAAPFTRLGDGMRRLLRWTAIIPIGLMLTMAIGWLDVAPTTVLIVSPVLVACWLLLSQFADRRTPAWDRLIGNYAYGVFLGHYVSTMLMFWAAETIYGLTGIFGIFGQPDVSELRLRVFAYAWALAFGMVIYYAFERPFETLRARVRTAWAARAGAAVPPGAYEPVP